MSDFDDKATVTGAIASFNNGADEVPVDSGTFYIAPSQSGTGTPSPSNPRPIVGYTGMTIQQTGKNLLHNEMEDGTTGGIDYSLNSDGSIDCSGTVSNVNSTRILATNIKLPAGSYVLSGADSSINLRCVVYAKDGTSANRNDTGSGVTVSITADTDYIEFRVKARTNAEVVSTTIYPMFEVGSTPSQFEAYKAKTPIVDAFGRTIYGGERDLTTDKASVTYSEPVVLTESMIDSATAYSYQSKNGVQIASVFPENVIRRNNHRCSHDVVKQGADSASHYLWFGSSTGNKSLYWIGILDDLNMTLAEWKAWAKTQTIQCSYVLPTSTELTGLTSHDISTMLGDNNFYADIPNSETSVEYYKSGYGYTSITVNRTGKNLIPISIIEQGGISGSTGEDLSSTVRLRTGKYIRVNSNETFSISITSETLSLYQAIQYDASKTYIRADALSGTSASLTMKSNTVYLRFTMKNASGTTVTVSDLSTIQVEKSSSPTVYEAYSGVTKTAKLHRIIYEGEVDVISGTGSISIGESGTEYDPPQEFTFPPISIETVEGTNVLYANEGDSTVTYRRSAD